MRFQQLDEGIYKGSKPKSDGDYEFLQSKGVKYMLELRLFPWLNLGEKRKAKKYGITLLTSTMNASTVEPSNKHVDAILCLLRDRRYHPIYFHCDLGRDRAMLIVDLYEMYYLGKSKEDAYKEMKYHGFKDSWTLSELKKYFEKYSQRPVSQYVPRLPSGRCKRRRYTEKPDQKQSIWILLTVIRNRANRESRDWCQPGK